jgi:hypothetical protein
MPPPAPLMPLLGLLATLVLAGAGGLDAAESGQQDQLTQQAKAEGHRRQSEAARLLPAPRADITRTATPTPLSIGTVTVASPALATQVPCFTKLELVVPLTTGVAPASFYNPDFNHGGLTLVGTFTGPSASWIVHGYYDGASWRIRFAADTVGAWSYVISAQDPSGPSTNTQQGSFTVVPNSGNHGWVRISGGHLLYSADQTPFIGIGHNNGWLNGVEQPAISAMPGIGENVLSFWLANPFTSANRNPIEASVSSGGQGIGLYNQTSCATIDALFADAEQAGVLLLPSIWAHDQLWDGLTPPPSSGTSSGSWPGNAYSEIIDPATMLPLLPTDFFRIADSSNAITTQWTYQTNFYSYLIARWGYSTSLLGWVGMVEIDQTTAYHASAGVSASDAASLGDAWCQSVQGYFALNDPFRGSGAAMGTVPVAFSKSDEGGPAALTFTPTSPAFSLRIADSYKSKTDPVGIATTIATETRILSANGATPCFHSEFAALVTNPDTLEPLHFHNAIWAGIAAGAALTPLKYCDGGSFPLITDATLGPQYQSHLRQLAAFVHSVPYAGSAAVTNAQLAVTGLVQNVAGATVGVNAWGQALTDRAFAWLQATNTDQSTHAVSSGSLGNGTLTVSGLSNGTYQASWYDPWGPSLTGSSVTNPTASGGTVSIAIPPSPTHAADIALSLRQLPSANNLTVSVVAGTTYAITLTGSAGGDTLSGASILTLPSAGTLNQTTDGISKAAAITTANTPVTANPPVVIYSAPATTGSDSFTYTVADGALVSPFATVTITIVPVNLPPTFHAGGNVVLNENSPAYAQTGWATLISNPPGDPSILTGFTVTSDNATLFTIPPMIDDVSGTLTFTTKPNVYTPAGQPVHVQVVLNDNGSTAGGGANASAPATFTITISQIALQPQLSPQTLTTYPTFPLTIPLNGSVADGAPLTYAATQQPAHGTLSVVSGPPAQAIYTANAGTSGADSFIVTATDAVVGGVNNGASLAASATMTLTIATNLPPIATAQRLGVPENQGLGIVLAGNDPDQAPNPLLTFTIGSQPAHGTLIGTPPSLTYTPQTDYVGADSFTFTAFDGLATSPPATVSITVLTGGSGSSSDSGGHCGSGNGFAALALLALTLGNGWRRRRLGSRR